MQRTCSHGKTWEEECPECERIFWEQVTKPMVKELAEEGHKWDEDGERCMKCGAKDWMGGPCTPRPDEESDWGPYERQ